MLEPRGNLDFSKKALRSQTQGELGMKHFEGDGAMVAAILGQEDGRHAPAPEVLLDGVTLSQRALQPALDGCHGRAKIRRRDSSRNASNVLRCAARQAGPSP